MQKIFREERHIYYSGSTLNLGLRLIPSHWKDFYIIIT